MLASFHRGGGSAAASRSGLGRSGATERITLLYSKFDAALRGARLHVRAIADAKPFRNMIEAGGAGLAIACTASRHHIPGAQ